jgi:site-specific DNA recombinase
MVTVLSQIELLYQMNHMELKKTVVGSLFPEKLWFDGMEHRTARINDAIVLCFRLTNSYARKKERQVTIFRTCPLGRTHPGTSRTIL